MESLRVVQQYLPGFFLPLVRLCIWLVLRSIVFVPLERLFAVRLQAIFRKRAGADLGYYFLSGLVPSLLLGTPLAVLAWSAHALLPDSIGIAVTHWPTWLRVVAALVIGEIGFYWGHRWSHQVPLLWQFHAIHHSAEHVDWLVNTRAHPVDMIFTRLCGLVPLYVLGLAAPLGGSASVILVIVLFLGTVWGFFVHANVRRRFGRLEWLSATLRSIIGATPTTVPPMSTRTMRGCCRGLIASSARSTCPATSDRRATAPIIQRHRACSSSCWDRSCRDFLRRSIP